MLKQLLDISLLASIDFWLSTKGLPLVNYQSIEAASLLSNCELSYHCTTLLMQSYNKQYSELTSVEPHGRVAKGGGGAVNPFHAQIFNQAIF